MHLSLSCACIPQVRTNSKFKRNSLLSDSDRRELSLEFGALVFKKKKERNVVVAVAVGFVVVADAGARAHLRAR